MNIVNLLSPGVLSALVIFGAFWKIDSLLSADASKFLAGALRGVVDDPTNSNLYTYANETMEKYFPINMPAITFISRVALITLTAMLVMLFVFMGKTSGFFNQVIVDDGNRWYFLRQFIFNGFVVVYAVNHVAFSVQPYLLAPNHTASNIRLVMIFIAEAAAKMVLFIAILSLTHVVFAELFNSFGGDRAMALAAVRPTIEQAILLENLSVHPRTY